MAHDVEQRFKESERLFKQGRPQVAVRELRQLASDAAGEPLLLNRVGDALARHGHTDEALAVFDKIAAEFAAAGFYPKSVAVLKKSLRLAPEHLPALLLLGDVYFRQEVPGEARALLLRAGDRCLKTRQIDRAVEIYEKLAALEPADPLHRVRLAETRALHGDAAGAAADLVEAGSALVAGGRAGEAESTFRRALELAPDLPAPVAGLARLLIDGGRPNDAVRLLEDAVRRRHAMRPALLGELCVLYERTGRVAEASDLLDTDADELLPEATFAAMVRHHAEAGRPAEGWKRVAPSLDRWFSERRFDRLIPVLERVAEIPGLDAEALERVRRVYEAAGDRKGLIAALERLVRAYWARSAHSPAAEALDALRLVAPESPLVSESVARRGVVPGPARPADPTPAVAVPRTALGLALPASRDDWDFVAARFTEAEAFQKYQLGERAEQQIREVTRRFPGHVEAHDKLVAVLRARRDPEALRAALVDLALARAASGDTVAAHDAAREAAAVRPLSDETRSALEQAGALTAPAAQAAAVTPPDTDDADIEIEFGDDTADTPGATPEGLLTAPSGDAATRIPPSDVLEEIAFFLDHGMRAEALEMMATLRRGGFGGDRLDGLERRAATDSAAAPPAGQDLHDLAGAGIRDLAAEAAGPVPEAGDQSVEDVFAAFKEQVAQQVGDADHRTHYDLGIAYKEMGLLDDAVGEFLLAAESADLRSEAAAMLGLCHRERGDCAEAARWLRAALESSQPGGPAMDAIRYDLAEVLAEGGDPDGALALLLEVQSRQPGYRDVESRIQGLRARPRP